MFKDVPNTVDFIAQEHQILGFWRDSDVFHKLKALRQEGPRWSFIDGPITANNPMGVHHAWGRTYKDLFQRFKAMQGYQTRYQNGFDCQGLWIEVNVERDMGFKAKKDIEAYGLDEFVNALQAAGAPSCSNANRAIDTARLLDGLERSRSLTRTRAENGARSLTDPHCEGTEWSRYRYS